MSDNCGLGHDVERISCEDAARAIIVDSARIWDVRDAAVFVLRLLDTERAKASGEPESVQFVVPRELVEPWPEPVRFSADDAVSQGATR